MNTSMQIEVHALGVEDSSARAFEKLSAFLRKLMSAASSQTKDQSYADYLETMAHLTGF